MKTKNGLWRLSPSGLYGYTDCRSCFWVDNHFKKAPMLPLALNVAMDSILKARYDKYRADGVFPPEAQQLANQGLKVFSDLTILNEWRSNLNALKVENSDAGYVLVGKIDDVLVEVDGSLVPADYKSSGKSPAEDKQKYYRDQLSAYGLMFCKHGHDVSNRAYLLHYFVKDSSDPSLGVNFDTYVDLVQIDILSIEQKLKDMVVLLNGPYPGHNPECQKCSYYDGRKDVAVDDRVRV